MNGPRPIDPAFTAGTEALTIPVPTGSRDVLPEEMSELREIGAAVLSTLAGAGYGEVATPAFEYEDTMRLAGSGATKNVYRLSDKDGKALVARFDSTIPIARLAASRYHDAEPPLRFSYLQSVYRPVEPKRGQSREFSQVGMELMGLPAPEGDAEAVRLLDAVLKAAGLSDFTIAVGDARLFIEQLDAAAGAELTEDERHAILYELQTGDMVGLRRELEACDKFDSAAAERLLVLARSRGGREVLDEFGAARLSALDELLAAQDATGNVIYDLGLVRSLRYYTGTVMKVYVPTDGFSIGGGGRYDNLAGRFGRDLPACGFAINLERLHIAVLAQRNGSS